MNIGPVIEIGDRPPEPLIIPKEHEVAPETQPQQVPIPEKEREREKV